MKLKVSRLFALIAALLTLAVPALAAISVVQPTDDFYVNDSASVLSEAVEGHIILNNDALCEACGAQIVFVTVDSVGSSTMENYAYTLFNDWGIGSAERNNGLLVLMAIEDDDYWLMQGSGLQDYITSGDLDEMAQRYLEPYFAAHDYDAGAKALFDALFKAAADAERISLTVDGTLYDGYIAAHSASQTAAPHSPYSSPYSSSYDSFSSHEEDDGSWIGGLIIVVIIILLLSSGKRRRTYRAAPPPRPPMGGSVHIPPMPRTPTYKGSAWTGRSRPSGFGSSYRPSNFGSSRPSGFGSSRPSGFGGSSRPSGGFRSSGFGGGRSGGGGISRGGGAGRHR